MNCSALIKKVKGWFAPFKINWNVRVHNKTFWVSLVPASLLLVQTGAAVFGVTLEVDNLGDRLLAVANAAFAVLAILGVVNDPTTKGISDSEQAMSYTEPKGK